VSALIFQKTTVKVSSRGDVNRLFILFRGLFIDGVYVARMDDKAMVVYIYIYIFVSYATQF
jgi:hypothetical protein